MTDNKKWILYLFILLAACVNLNVYEENQAVHNASWPCNTIFRFEYLASDTLSSENVFINLRHNDFYKYNNIYMFVTTIAPNGKSLKDTVEFIIADVKGKWIGTGVGNIHDLRLAYKHNIRFGQKGRYVFCIQQGMREKELKGITDVGLRIEKVK